MRLYSIASGSSGNCIYIENETTHLLVDAGISGKRVIEGLESIGRTILDLDAVLITHEHYDHIAALNALRKITNAKVICSQVCSERMQDADKNLSSIFKVQLHFMGKDPNIVVEPYHCEPADITYTESFAMEWEGMPVWFFRAPGHSPGSAMIVFDDVIFVGDSLSLDHDVIIRKRYGSKDDYRKIVVPFLLAKSQESMIYPGHGKNFRLSQRITYLESIKNR